MKALAPLFLVLAGLVFGQSGDLHRLALMTYGGAPSGGQNIKVLMNTGYAVGYSDDLKVPLWAVYRLGNLKSQTDFEKWERPSRFIADPRTTSKVEHEDFERNWDGVTWDRGHMAPNSAMERQYGQAAQTETYFMSNIVPQTSSLNQGVWGKLEERVREVLSQDDTTNEEIHDLWVIAGPIFENEPVDKWPSGIAVPTHCYKILAYRKGYRGTAKAVTFIFPQKPTSTDPLDYLSTVDEVESLTGLDFFPGLSIQKQRNLESVKRDFALNTVP